MAAAGGVADDFNIYMVAKNLPHSQANKDRLYRNSTALAEQERRL